MVEDSSAATIDGKEQEHSSPVLSNRAKNKAKWKNNLPTHFYASLATRSVEEVSGAIDPTAGREWKVGSQAVPATASKEEEYLVQEIGFSTSFWIPHQHGEIPVEIESQCWDGREWFLN